MTLFDPKDTALAAIVNAINASTATWQVSPLPPNLVVVNGTLPIGSSVNGYIYYGEESDLGDTIVFEWTKVGNVGTLPLSSFVYLMISAVVVITLLVLPNCPRIAGLLLGNDKHFGGGKSKPNIGEFVFDLELRKFYPTPPTCTPLPSYLEEVTYSSGKQVSSSDIRDCQSMIRKIYALKVDAFNARDARRGNQDIVTGWKTQATAGLNDVKSLVDRWVQGKDWSAEEKAKVDLIRQRILAIQPDA